MAIFYALQPDGSLHDNMGVITWKVGTFTDDRDPGLREFRGTSSDIEFTHGIFETEDKDHIEYLNMYNTGGRFHEGKKDERVIKPTNFPIITLEDPYLKKTGGKIIEKETVTVVQIPKMILETMTVNQIEQYFYADNIELPTVVTKESLIDTLIKAGKVA